MNKIAEQRMYAYDAEANPQAQPTVAQRTSSQSGLFLKNPSIAGVFKVKMVKLFFHRY
ncbi:MAG: hypothetical protein R2830_15670 [Saprospiraceae bacterium]